MGIWKSAFKILSSSITLLDASFTHCSPTLLRGGRGEKHKTVQIAVFPIIFVTNCLKNLQNLKCGILVWLILSQIEGIHLPIKSLWYVRSQTNSLITWTREAKYIRSKFCKFFSLPEIWGRLTHFSVTNLLSIYDYILDKWVNRWNF